MHELKIVLDPGHSGPFEPGACAGGVTEAGINLQIARYTCEEMKLHGYEVRLTRDDSIEDAELDWRAEMANSWGADLFLCLHCNAAQRIEAEGTETYHYPGSEPGERLARLIQYRLTDALLTEDRGVKSANYQVLRETDCPAVLIEFGFITNPVDRGMLTDPPEQWRMGAALAAAVDDYEKQQEKS